MNNDLISREALKKAFEKVYPLSTNEMGGVVNKRIYDIIDNAPTVEPFEKIGSICEENCGYRPQGKWKLDSLGAYCSECGTHPDYTSNFCPNCGADMKGGAE